MPEPVLRRMTRFGLLMLLAGYAGATEILRETNTPNLGLAVYPLAEQTWRSPVMRCPEPVREQDRVWTGPDFFESEYGAPCVFTADCVQAWGYVVDGSCRATNGFLVCTPGPKGFSFGFGAVPRDFSRPSARFGAAWGPQGKDNFRLRMTVEQDVETSVWTFATSRFNDYSREESSFTIHGRGRQIVEADVGIVAYMGNCTGFKLHADVTSGVVRIRDIRIAPSSANVYFRRAFTLARRPILAHTTFQSTSEEVHDLYVNGRRVSSGSRIYPGGPQKTVDLAPFLVAGSNVIAFRREFIAAWQNTPNWLFEGVAVDRDGGVTHLTGDADWTCTLRAAEGWQEPGFDDAAWSAPLLSPYAIALADGTQVAQGLEPRHMGMLDVAPEGRDYPVFDVDESPSFRVRLPIGVRGRLQPHLDLFQAGAETKVESVAAGAPQETADFLVYRFAPKTRTAGPYRLIWTLRDGAGAVVETRREELIRVGPIVQETLPLAGFEECFAKRLKLERKIDCARERGDDAEFLDHAGMYHPAQTNRGRVVTADGMRYRETGSGVYDYFAYRLHLRERGATYLIEIVIPDNRPRYVASCVVESYPIPFCNNFARGNRGWITSSGAALTGTERYPLSGGRKTLRYLYHPGSFNAAVVVMSGAQDAPAAACEINLYRVADGLPALAIPPTDRRFGQHNERLSTMALTMAVDQPLELDVWMRRNGHRDAWANGYRAIERKIRFLRFQGQNMTVEGVYMYDQGDYPSLRHNRFCSNQEFDLPHLMLRMYARNDIRCLLGFEYCNSPAVAASGTDTVSDRRVWQGAPGMHMVDRHGRQLVGSFSRDGINFLDPRVEATMLDTLGEIYDRYQGVGRPEGLFMVTGDWWAPGFIRGGYRDVDATEVGYDDLTVGLFERETGIHLGIAADDPRRFQARYDLLMGAHRALWLHWRGVKLRACMQRLSDRIRRGANKWDLQLYPSSGWGVQKDSPFFDATTPRPLRDAALDDFLVRSGVPREHYRGQTGINLVTPLLEIDFFRNRRLTDDTAPFHGLNTNPGSREVLRQLGSLYLTTQLNEVDFPASAAARWLWDSTLRGVFVLRGAGDNAMHPFVDVIRDSTPRDIFSCWLDCNLETAHGEAQRRFAKAFYATPDVTFEPLPPERARGVLAQAAPRPSGAWLRLVNPTPYALTGTLRGGAFHDCVYDGATPGGRVELKPNDIRIFSADAAPDKLACELALPREVADGIRKQAARILASPAFLRDVPRDQVARLFQAQQQEDPFSLYLVMDDYEVAAHIKRAKAEAAAFEQQELFLEDLGKTGSARVDCAGERVVTDGRGRRWLPDQPYLACGAYGNEFATYADRGNLTIADTDAERVYQTEAYGAHVFYRIPLPKGKFHVHLHVAETYEPIRRAGIRLFSVKVENHLWEQPVDPFVAAGGFARAAIVSEQNVGVDDGVLDIELRGGVGVQGIEIEMAR